MATSISDILERLGRLRIVAPPSPLVAVPVSPSCTPWCRGQGARRVASPPRPIAADGVPSYLETMRAVAYEYCDCPAGDDARERHRAALDSLEVAATQRQASVVLDTAELPPKLRRHGLDDYPSLAPMVAKLRRWQPASRSAGVNLLLWGDIGTYKTSLGAALLREHLADGGSGLFLRCRAFLARIRASYGDGASADDQRASEWTLVKAAASPGLLLLDDIPSDLSTWAQGILFDLLDARDLHERATILTTNLDLAATEASLGKRTFDRFRGGAVEPVTGEQFVIRLQGASQRGLRAVAPSGARHD